MDQYYGLNTWARDLLSSAVRVIEAGTQTFPDGRQEPFERTVFVPVHKATVISAIDGSQNLQLYMLHRHEFPDGTAYEEYVQAVALYSGPCYFIALKKEGEVVDESLWEQEEMKVG